jgi:hypothetical protein
MRKSRVRAVLTALFAACALAAGCGNGDMFKPYEYEEELYLSLDGSGTLYVNASVAALVALRGVELDTNPRARLDRERVRAAFTSPATHVTRITTSRRQGRLFVHVRMDVDDVRALDSASGLAWSRYKFSRAGDVFVYEQTIGESVGRDVGNVGWDGSEAVAFRIHLPSKVPFHNAAALRRGNILVWEQPLRARLSGTPVRMEAHMEPESILYRTLSLFALCIGAVIVTFVVIIWAVMRKGAAPAASEADA